MARRFQIALPRLPMHLRGLFVRQQRTRPTSEYLPLRNRVFLTTSLNSQGTGVIVRRDHLSQPADHRCCGVPDRQRITASPSFRHSGTPVSVRDLLSFLLRSFSFFFGGSISLRRSVRQGTARQLTFDMSGRRRSAKAACDCPLDREVMPLRHSAPVPPSFNPPEIGFVATVATFRTPPLFFVLHPDTLV